eukprot:261815_1
MNKFLFIVGVVALGPNFVFGFVTDQTVEPKTETCIGTQTCVFDCLSTLLHGSAMSTNFTNMISIDGKGTICCGDEECSGLENNIFLDRFCTCDPGALCQRACSAHKRNVPLLQQHDTKFKNVKNFYISSHSVDTILVMATKPCVEQGPITCFQIDEHSNGSCNATGPVLNLQHSVTQTFDCDNSPFMFISLGGNATDSRCSAPELDTTVVWKHEEFESAVMNLETGLEYFCTSCDAVNVKVKTMHEKCDGKPIKVYSH